MERQSQEPRQRDIVFCHQCENEWFRDEHGLTCPECQSEFVEIVDSGHDPRAEAQAQVPQHQHGEFHRAPDPDEDDIDNIQWQQTGPDTYRARINRTIDVDPTQFQQQQGQGMGGGILSALGNLVFGGGQGQQPVQQQGQDREPRPQSPSTPTGGRAASAPGQGRGGTTVRHWHGPGFHATVMTSSGGDFGGRGLLPRNPNVPQPFQQQPDHMEQMMQQMLMNIAPMTPGGHPMGQGPMGGGMLFGPPPGMGGPQHPFIGSPFGNILQMFGMPGQMGDAVFSQEQLDRVITHLMEQHQTGNAPGPASEEAIKRLPTRELTEKDMGDNGKAECSICMDEVRVGTVVTELPCHHWFHGECIKAWLSEHDTCPHCRQGIMPKDEADSNRPRDPSQPPLNDMNSPEYHGPRGMPGGFPANFQRQGSGSQQNPFIVPDSPSPGMHRRSSSTPGGGRQGNGSGGTGMFQRMREAFSPSSTRDNNPGSSGNSGGNGAASGSSEGAPK